MEPARVQSESSSLDITERAVGTLFSLDEPERLRGLNTTPLRSMNCAHPESGRRGTK